MLVVDGPGLVIQGDEGERINVKVSKQGTVFQVTYVLDGQDNVLTEGDSISFTLGSDNPQRLLTLTLGFTPDDGKGKYVVTVTGDKGGDPFSKTFKANAGITVLVKGYTFVV